MIFFVIFLIFCVILYINGTKNYKYWQERGIKYDQPWFLFGNNTNNFIGKKSTTQIAVEMYRKYPNEKVVGFFRGTQPELLIRDPEIIRRILSVDFYHFYNRGFNFHKKVIEPLLRNVFFADGDLWKLLRQRITPGFTSGKLKAMFPLVSARAERLQEVLAAATEDKERTFDARDIMARYTTDFIGSVGFGLDSDSLNDENSTFRKLGKTIFHITLPVFTIAMLKKLFPETCKHLKVLYKVEKDLIDLVKQILKQRNYAPSGRNDFIDLMLECRNKGDMLGESIEKIKEDGTAEIIKMELDDNLLAAQVFIFFAAGFETSSSATSFTLHQLAYHQNVQKKVQEEIDMVLAKYNNQLSYDAINEMIYLDWSLKEGMRIFPSLGFLARKCSRKYTFPELDVTIDPDVSIMIPIQALHTDPKYFKNPEEFRPERFHSDEFDKEAMKFVYLPFGEGPRNCIGERLGRMQSLAGLAAVLSKFTVEPAPETKRHLVVETRSNFVQSITGGLPLLFRRRT